MSFSREQTVKATRKPCRCIACNTAIAVGQSAIRCTGMVDGDFNAVAYHPECRAAEIAFNDLRGTYGDDWGGLDEMEREDREWLLIEHPIVAARMTPTPASNAATGEKETL